MTFLSSSRIIVAERRGPPERGGEQPQQQLLVGLARGEDADVAEGRGGQQPAEQVEGLRLDRALPGASGSSPRGHRSAAHALTSTSERE